MSQQPEGCSESSPCHQHLVSASASPRAQRRQLRLREGESCSAPHSMSVTEPEPNPWPLPVSGRGVTPLFSLMVITIGAMEERGPDQPLLMAGYWAKTLTTTSGGSSCYCSHLTEEKTEAQGGEVRDGACIQAELPQRLGLGLPVLSCTPALLTPTGRRSPGPCASRKLVEVRPWLLQGQMAWPGPRVAIAHSKTSDQLPRAQGGWRPTPAIRGIPTLNWMAGRASRTESTDSPI